MDIKQRFQDAYNNHYVNARLSEFWHKTDYELETHFGFDFTDKELCTMTLVKLLLNIKYLEMYLKGENEDKFKIIGDTLYMVDSCCSDKIEKIASIHDIETIDEHINNYLNY